MGQQASDEIRQRLAFNARRTRLALSLTQEQAAERLECSVQTLQRVERAAANPSLAFLERLAVAYDTDLQALLAPAGPWRSPRVGRPQAKLHNTDKTTEQRAASQSPLHCR